jgi:hypothetical protein
MSDPLSAVVLLFECVKRRGGFAGAMKREASGVDESAALKLHIDFEFLSARREEIYLNKENLVGRHSYRYLRQNFHLRLAVLTKHGSVRC